MFKLCVFVALLSLAAAAPAPAPAPVPAPAPSGLIAPGLIGPGLVAAPGIWGPTIIGGPHVVSVVPQAISHAAITQVHPSPLLLKSVHGIHGPVLVG